jgi:hypothetical protein
MVSALRLARSAAVPVVLAVSVVPGFSQTNKPDTASALDRTSTTAVREYDPAVRLSPAHVSLPANLIVSNPFHAVVASMLQRSATFRRQCTRIAEAPDLTVRLDLPSGQLPSGTRARTRVTRAGTNRVAAIEIPALDNVVELIAHEIEHVIEQLDGIDLPAHAARKDSSVTELESDETMFETVRARRVGALVASEVRQQAVYGRADLGIREDSSSRRRR